MRTLKTLYLVIAFCGTANLYAQTQVEMYVNTNKNQTWRGMKLQDKRQGIQSLASKLLKANKDGLLQAYYLTNKDKMEKIDYKKVTQNMEVPGGNGLNHYLLEAIKGATLVNYEQATYIILRLGAAYYPTGEAFPIVSYRLNDVEQLLKCKFTWKYSLCEDDTCLIYFDDENTVKPFVADPPMPEFELKN